LDGALERVNLLGPQGGLRRLQLSLQVVQRWQLVRARHVELLEQPVQAIRTPAAPLDQAEPRAQDIPRVGDRLQELRMRQVEVNALRDEEITEPGLCGR
jgi:hypothetical protein